MKEFIITSIKKIKKAVENNKLVIFVGAGVSANSGLPTWYQLIEKLAFELDSERFIDKDCIEKSCKKFKSTKISSDEFLKIPQYYFNERGNKEYYDKIYEILDIPATPNPIHDLIFKLNPAHIITTNYDTLLEDSKNSYFHVVKENQDLPYAVQNRMIIKMHGDLKTKNIVLKEDDYLSYQNNFKLIDIFVKALFASHLVLFVGFGADDPNFNLIFQSVKDILQESFQPAYFIETSNKFDSIKFNYFKNRGINILYFQEIVNHVEEWWKLSPQHEQDKLKKFNGNQRGETLFKSLSYIVHFNIEDDKSLLERVYTKLQLFEKMNALLPYDIINELHDLSLDVVYFDTENAICIRRSLRNDVDFEGFINLLKNNSLDEKVNYILKTFKKSRVNSLRKDINEIIITFYEPEKILEPLLYDIFNFNLSLLEEKLSAFDLTNTNDILTLRKLSYCYFKLGLYIKSYEVLEKISRLTEGNNHFEYFLSEYNKKNLKNFIPEFSNNYEQEKLQKIIKEINNINLEEISLKLPLSYRKYLLSIDSMDFCHKYNTMISSSKDKLIKFKQHIESGGGGFNSELKIMWNLILSLYEFVTYNYLFIENFGYFKVIFTSFIEGLLASYSIIEKDDDTTENIIKFPIDKITEFNSFYIYLAINYIDTETLERMLKNYNIKVLKVDTECKEYLLNIFSNLVNYLDEEKIGRSNFSPNFISCLKNILVILSKVELDSKEFSSVIKKFEILFEKGLIYR